MPITKATMITCPHCRQRMSGVRFGMHLRPIQVRIVDAITKAPGIERADLTALIYGDRDVSRHIISVHVNQINSELMVRGWVIKGGPWGYHLTRLLDEAVA